MRARPWLDDEVRSAALSTGRRHRELAAPLLQVSGIRCVRSDEDRRRAPRRSVHCDVQRIRAGSVHGDVQRIRATSNSGHILVTFSVVWRRAHPISQPLSAPA